MTSPVVKPDDDKGFDPDWAIVVPILVEVAKVTNNPVDDQIVRIAGGLLADHSTGNIIKNVLMLLGSLLFNRRKNDEPKPDTTPVPITTPAPPVQPVVVSPVPPLPPPVTSTQDFEPVALNAKLRMLETPSRIAGRRGVEDREWRRAVLAGSNAHSDSWFHTDCSPFGADGTEITTNDARWAFANRWAPNGCPIWLYYEWNGQSTLDGHHAEEVEPGSVENDQGCTPTYKVHGPGKFRFGFQYLRKDGTLIDSGLIGQGNVPGDKDAWQTHAFNIGKG